MPTLTRIYILSGNTTDNGVSLTGCQKLIWFQGVGIFFYTGSKFGNPMKLTHICKSSKRN